jgi:hypothetical protein
LDQLNLSQLFLSKQGTGYRLARPGETHDPVSGEPARLYDVWNIFAFQQLDEFGIGISLYFRQLLLLFVVIGVCAGVNLMTIMNNVDIINSRREDCPSTLLGSVYGAVREDLKMSNQVSVVLQRAPLLPSSLPHLLPPSPPPIPILSRRGTPTLPPASSWPSLSCS